MRQTSSCTSFSWLLHLDEADLLLHLLLLAPVVLLQAPQEDAPAPCTQLLRVSGGKEELACALPVLLGIVLDLVSSGSGGKGSD